MNTLVITPSVRALAQKIVGFLAGEHCASVSRLGTLNHAQVAVFEDQRASVERVSQLIAQDNKDAMGFQNGGFNLGDQVEWTSQAGGSTTRKVGTIAEVVAAKTLPDRVRFLSLHKSSGVGMSRNHVSYVVLVMGKPYWPVVKKLNRTAVAV